MAHRAWTQNSRKQRRATKKLRHRHLAPRQRLPTALSPPSSAQPSNHPHPRRILPLGTKLPRPPHQHRSQILSPGAGAPSCTRQGRKGGIGAPSCTRRGGWQHRVALGREAKGQTGSAELYSAGKPRGKGRHKRKPTQPTNTPTLRPTGATNNSHHQNHPSLRPQLTSPNILLRLAHPLRLRAHRPAHPARLPNPTRPPRLQQPRSQHLPQLPLDARRPLANRQHTSQPHPATQLPTSQPIRQLITQPS